MPLLIIAILWFLLDRLVKYLVVTNMVEGQSTTVIPGFFHITSIRNPGGAWGVFAHQIWLFVLVSVIVSLVILVVAFRPEGKRFWTALALGLVLGGAVGNLYDRLLNKVVVDMFEFNFGSYHYPVFNVADIGIDVGVALLLIGMLLADRRAQREKGDEA